MGPTNVALVKLFQADQALRAAQARLDAASKNLRIQDRRVAELAEKLRLAQRQLMEQQSKAGQFELDIKSRDARIDKLRTQQQNAKNNKEYQTFLVEINTEKTDKGKTEDELMKVMEINEKSQAEIKDLVALLDAEKAKLAAIQSQITDTLAKLQAEVDSLRPARGQAATEAPARILAEFERLADRYEGESLAPIARPDPRREEYICGGCHIELVVDVYNRLHTKDDIVFCPSCRRILYIPNDLPPEIAIKKPREKKEPRVKASNVGASVTRQTSASDVLRSLTPESEESETASEPPAQA